MTREALHVGRRALGREHFTWYRGLMEGLDRELLWDRYLPLEGEFSAPLADATAQWIRLELLALAQQKRPELLGLLRRDPRRIKVRKVPTIDEFAETFGDPDFYSQAELQELWTEQYGHRQGKSAERRQHLAERLRLALQSLEDQYTKVPALEHAVGQWFVPQLAGHLAQAGLVTLGALVAHRRAAGDRWWTNVHRLGDVAAGRLGAWLEAQFPTPPSPPSAAQLYGVGPNRVLLGAAPQPSETQAATNASARTAPDEHEAWALGLAAGAGLAGSDVAVESAPSPALRPFSTVAPPVSVDLSIAKRSLIAATSDEGAVESWLNAKATNPTTRRAYAREAGRLMLWCQKERGKGFADLRVEDCTAYRLWLSQLGTLDGAAWDTVGWRVPQQAWIGPRAPRRSTQWRPFGGPLAHDSQAQAVIIATALFRFLHEGGYLRDGNPWALIGKPALPPTAQSELVRPDDAGEAKEDQFVARSLSEEQREFLLNRVRQDDGILARRMELTLQLGFYCGLRASEMCSLNLWSLRVDDKRGWRLRVLGKGSKVRSVPFPTPAVDALLKYAAACDIDEARLRMLAERPPADPSKTAAKPLPIPMLRSHSNREKSGEGPIRLGYRGLHAALAKLLRECTALLELSDPASAQRFSVASLHWLRHTFATLMIESGEAIKVVQEILGHEDISTTGGYITAGRKKRQEAAERFAAKSAEETPRT